MSQPPISVDFETFYIDKEYSIREMGADAYVRDARFNPYLISVCDGSDTWAGPIKEFNWDALQGGRILLSHNAGFDRRVHREMVRRGWAPPIDFKAWHCTANLTTYLAMRRDLARATEFLLGVSVDKSYRTDANGKTWEDMVAAGVSEKVKEAGRVDAARCWQFFAKFGHLWPELEQKLSDMTVRQCMRGCAMDRAELDRQLVSAQSSLILADSILPWVAAGRAPTSPKAIAEKCREVGIPAPPVKSKDGDEAYDEWAELYGPKHGWVKAYTDYRVINKHISTLETLKARLHEDDGIFPYDLLYFGAHTGRWAGSGGFNLQNMRKVPLYFDAGKMLITDTPRLKEISKAKSLPAYVADSLDVRRLLVPRKGCRMMAPDLSQIEPRVLAWLVKDLVMLDLMARGISPYQAHAVATMGWSGVDMKKEDAELYALAKARVLGLGFGCGWRKFITVAMTMAGLDITAGDPEWVEARNDEGEVCLDMAQKPIMISGYGTTSRRIVKEYREQNPLIASNDSANPGIWKRLDDAFRASAGTTFEMELPSGRILRYPEVMQEFKRVADPDRPGKWISKRVFTALAFDQKRNGIVRKPFYGGLLTENLVQATARDIFGECCVALDQTPGINVLWTVHDEAVIEVEDPLITTDQVREIMRRPVSWMPGLPVDCELEVIPHYKK